MKTAQKLGIYIHLPFCHSKCAYCDFYSLPQGKSKEEQMVTYQEALLAHMKILAPSAKGFSVDTIYFGGGTPTLYGASRIDQLLRTVKKLFRVERDAEITVEGNPESVDKKTVGILRRCGVNRVSLGMQTAVDSELHAIGRAHSAQDCRQAVSHLKEGQMKNISLDLIYGLPQQNFSSWMVTVEEAIALEPQHLSCYGLKVEEGTPLFQRVAQGEPLPSEEEQAELYLWTVARLGKAGYVQYEISNFAQKNLRSRHNMGYWLGKPYLGFGASASSDFGGYRTTMVADIDHYCACVLGGESQIFSSNELMSTGDRQEEYLILRLRTCEGILGEAYEKSTGLDFTPLAHLLQRYEEEGWAICVAGRWTFTPEGYLRSNLLLGSLLEAQEKSGKAKPQIRLAPPEEKRKISQTKEIVFLEDEEGQFHF